MKNTEKDFIEIPKLKIKVQKEISAKLAPEKLEEYCEERGARILNVLEGRYLLCNFLIPNLCNSPEGEFMWCVETEQIVCVQVTQGTLGTHRLYIHGSPWHLQDHSSGVRLVYPLDN